MNYQIAIPEDQITAFCQQWGVAELSIFGSALRDDFSSDSDIDMLVKFKPDVNYTLWDLLEMEAELKDIFQQDVDLGEKRAVERDPNYIRRKNILDSAQVIYATG